MDKVRWQLWTPEQIVENLPQLIAEAEANVERESEENQERDRAAIASLRASMPSVAELRAGERESELVTLGLALDAMGRQSFDLGDFKGGLRLFQTAYELFVGGDASRLLRPTKPMRQCLWDASRAVLAAMIPDAESGETDAGAMREELRAFVTSAWGGVPSQIDLQISEMVLIEIERIRASQEDSPTFHDRFVRDNLEAVLGMEVPSRLSRVQDRWEDEGEHIAPDIVRIANKMLRRPRDLSTVLSQTAWASLREAVEKGDINSVRDVLSEAEADVEANLRLRLNARPDYRMPTSEVRWGPRSPDPNFIRARDLLLLQDSGSLAAFRELHFRNNSNSYAKEWYAYALARFGSPTDVHEIIDLSQDALVARYYNPTVQWVVRWNLACALTHLPTRQREALDILLPVLKYDAHVPEAFELCLLWAIDYDRDDVLDELLVKSPYGEAHLLAALREATRTTGEGGIEFGDHFRRLNRIIQDPDRVFPQPEENLSQEDLERLTRDFVEAALVEAGVEWFRQRVSFPNERRFFKNWECAAQVNEANGDLESAWRCRVEDWECTWRTRQLHASVKTARLRSLLAWANEHEFRDRAVTVLRRAWKSIGMPESELLMWEERLRGETTKPWRETPPKIPEPPEGPKEEPPEDPEAIIQGLAMAFNKVRTVGGLAEKANEAENLVGATRLKHEDLSIEAVGPIREIVRIASRFKEGVDEDTARDLAANAKEQLSVLRSGFEALPYELIGLAQACERAAQDMAVQAREVSTLQIVPPSALGMNLALPEDGNQYHTRLFVRLANSGLENADSIKLACVTPSSSVVLPEEPVELPLLRSGESRVLDFPMQILAGLESKVDLTIISTYRIGGIASAAKFTDHLSVQTTPTPIPISERYITSAPVAADRTDLFHGRSSEIARLLEAFSTGQMTKLYFVNGIRAVGKSSLMLHLGNAAGPDILPLMLNLEAAIGAKKVSATQVVRQLAREGIKQIKSAGVEASLRIPDAAAFDLDPPWVVFDEFLESATQAAGKKVLICFDELQRLVNEIADPESPMDDGFLSWLRSKIQAPSDVFIVCTGSEPYGITIKRAAHTVWRNMEAFNISFVDRRAMEEIATKPVKKDAVVWLPEALDVLWDMTEGHPWIIQILAERVSQGLNDEKRRVVGPADVERAAEGVAADDPRVSDLWWNEKEGLLNGTHRQIAFLILQHQSGARAGVPEAQLAEACQKSGIKTVGRHLEEMKTLEVISATGSGEPGWRIRGAFLEKHLETLLQRFLYESNARLPRVAGENLALMIDWENTKIPLLSFLEGKPPSPTKRSRLNASHAAERLLELATPYGFPRQRWIVADWDRGLFEGEQKIFAAANYHTGIASSDKANASDHVLVERIHAVLRDCPEIGTYIIVAGDGDYRQVIGTLREHGKYVILWSTRTAINNVYGEALKGPDRIEVEWLEDTLLEESSATASDLATSDE